jgi:hypothetical protein
LPHQSRVKRVDGIRYPGWVHLPRDQDNLVPDRRAVPGMSDCVRGLACRGVLLTPQLSRLSCERLARPGAGRPERQASRIVTGDGGISAARHCRFLLQPPAGHEFHHFQQSSTPGNEKYIALFDVDM